MELNKIYNEDCLEGMKKIKDNSIDLIVTDPPYLINYKTGRRKDKNHRFKDRKSTRLNSSHVSNSYAVFCLEKKTTIIISLTSEHHTTPIYNTLSLHDALPIFI